MNINKNNYEAYFLDYHEGNLSPEEVADLFLFLSEYPELKKELDDFENIVLDDFSAPVFENKESLKKNITPDNREDYFIRAVEGTLDANELILLQTFLTTHPEFLKEFNQFEKTKLHADPTLIFENKEELKQLTEQDQLLISSIEGLLSKNEQAQLEKELSVNAELKKAFLLYQHTKSIANPSVIFADKQSLKRKEHKAIPLFYYISSAAAAIAVIIGLFFLFRTTTPTIHKEVAQQKNTTTKQPATTNPLQAEKLNRTTSVATLTAAGKKKNNRQFAKKQPSTSKPEEPLPSKTDEDVVITTPSITPVITDSKLQTQITPVDSNLLEAKKNIVPAIAKMEKKPAQLEKTAFPSIGDLVTNKLKEKLVGKDAPAKLSGWDIAGAFAKGLSNLTGKKVAVKTKVNKEGEVTAYAFSAGKIEFSRVK